MKSSLILLVAFLLGTIFAPAQNGELALKAGDRVTITIAGIPDNEIVQISKVYTVADNGTINMPYIREVRAQGMKPSSLQRNIEQTPVTMPPRALFTSSAAASKTDRSPTTTA